RPSSASTRSSPAETCRRCASASRVERGTRDFAHHLHHRLDEPREIALADHEGRRQVDDVAEGPYPDAELDEARAQLRDVGRARELHRAERAEHAYVGDTAERPARLEPVAELRRDSCYLRESRLLLEEIQRGVGGGAGERVTRV